MKKNYSIKTFLLLGLLAFAFLNTNAQIRIVEVNPATETVKLHNYGASTVDVSSYWFCNLFNYTQVSDGTLVSGSTSLAAGADLVVTMAVSLNDTASDLGLYQSASFGSSTAMLDFTQWGSGGNGRENVAVNKGIWTAGTFISAPAPYEYTGNGAQNGFQFWDTLLGVNDLDLGLNLKLHPNPSDSVLNVTLQNGEANISIQVYDILGKLVYNQNLNANNRSQIDVSELKQGLYLIKLTVGDKTEIKRFIKN